MGKPNERSALFLDRSYISRKFAELRTDMIAVMETKFRAVQNNQEKIIKLLERNDDKPRKQEIISETYTWKIEVRRRANRMVKDYPKLCSDFNNVLTRIYQKMHDVYGFVSGQAIKDYRYAIGAEKTSCLEVISEDEKLQSLSEPILSNLEGDNRKEMKRRRMAQEAEQGRTQQKIIQSLIETRGDRTNFGCATYTIVESRVRKHDVRPDDCESEFRKRTGIKRGVSNGELIDNMPTLRRGFVKAMGGLLTEHQNMITKTQVQQVNAH